MGYQNVLVHLANGDTLKTTIFNADQFELPAERSAFDTRDIVDIDLAPINTK